MAQELINIGTAPNAGDGDPLRTGFHKTNQNFSELYATATSLTASLAALTAALEAMDLSAFVSTTQAQSFGVAERAQHARNAGCPVTLAFRLLARDVTITPQTFVLPPLPWPFWLMEGLLVADSAGTLSDLNGVTASGLDAFETVAWGNRQDGEPFRVPIGVTGQLQRGELLHLTIGEVEAEYEASVVAQPTGLSLWLKGVWTL